MHTNTKMLCLQIAQEIEMVTIATKHWHMFSLRKHSLNLKSCPAVGCSKGAACIWLLHHYSQQQNDIPYV